MIKVKENYPSHSKKLNSLGYVLLNVAKIGEKCLKECNNLSRNSAQLS